MDDEQIGQLFVFEHCFVDDKDEDIADRADYADDQMLQDDDDVLSGYHLQVLSSING